MFDTKETFHAKMGSIKDRNGMDLIEAEDIKKRWQEYPQQLYKKGLSDLDKGSPRDSVGKESVCNVEDLGSIPKLGRSPGEVNQIPTPVFWPGKFHRLYSPWGLKELDTTEQITTTV